jgi:HD-GYP domain-containing protein (c-di-GMP phosphodiesterase class II)
MGARIISVADSYNAMTSDRTYRHAMPHERAIDQLAGNAGTQFDPEVVDAFLRVLAAEGEAHAVELVHAAAPGGAR